MVLLTYIAVYIELDIGIVGPKNAIYANGKVLQKKPETKEGDSENPKRFLPLTTTSWVIPTGTLCLPLNRGDHPTPVLGRHPYSYPFHVQRLHPRKGLFGIHLDTALLAFAHLGARHDTRGNSSPNYHHHPSQVTLQSIATRFLGLGTIKLKHNTLS